MIRYISGLLFLLIISSPLSAQHRGVQSPHGQIISSLLHLNTAHRAVQKTTAGVLSERVVAQSTRDNTLGTLADSVKLGYGGPRGSTYDYNGMLYPYNYSYSTSPMFNYSSVFTSPQVLYDTYVHWTLNPFTMPSFVLYEASFAGYDLNNNLTDFRELFTDSVTNDNRSYVNEFTATDNISTGYWFNLNAGIADSAFKQFFSYNSSDKLIADSVYELHLGVWRIAAKSSYSYDGAGNLTQINHYANETDISFLLPLVQQSKYVNTYDASNRLITVLTSIYDGTTLGEYVKDTFGYSGTLTYHNSWKQHQFDGIHGTWWPQYYMSKHITAGKPDTIYHKGWDSIAHSWVPISKDIMSYNADSNPDTMLNFEWNWTSYSITPDYTTVYYYDTFTIPSPPALTHIPAKASMKVFPNPATDNIYIAIEGVTSPSSLIISIYNLNGQIMSRQSVAGTAHYDISVAHLSPGVYWLSADGAPELNGLKKQFIKY
jgi:hypothetical protein